MYRLCSLDASTIHVDTMASAVSKKVQVEMRLRAACNANVTHGSNYAHNQLCFLQPKRIPPPSEIGNYCLPEHENAFQNRIPIKSFGPLLNQS